MGRQCCVSSCTQDAKPMFRVPEILSTPWMRIIDRPGWEPRKHTRICSKHFSPNDVINYRFLRQGAEPRETIISGIYIHLLFPGVYILASQKIPPPPKFFPVFVDFLRSFKLHKGILTCLFSSFPPPFPFLLS